MNMEFMNVNGEIFLKARDLYPALFNIKNNGETDKYNIKTLLDNIECLILGGMRGNSK